MVSLYSDQEVVSFRVRINLSPTQAWPPLGVVTSNGNFSTSTPTSLHRSSPFGIHETVAPPQYALLPPQPPLPRILHQLESPSLAVHTKEMVYSTMYILQYIY